MQQMFQEGLPLRGAISIGEFFIKDHCFVGKAITDCHDFASKTEWAGCALVPNAEAEFKKIDIEWRKKVLEQVCMPYRVPLKRDNPNRTKRARSLVLKWHHYDVLRTNGPMPDIRKSVHRSFSDHGKPFAETDESVIRKARNTIAYLEYVSTLYWNANCKMPKRVRQKLQFSKT